MNLKLTDIKIQNFFGYKNAKFEGLKDYNVLIGQNNAGKSNLSRTLMSFQKIFNDKNIFDSNWLFDGKTNINITISLYFKISKKLRRILFEKLKITNYFGELLLKAKRNPTELNDHDINEFLLRGFYNKIKFKFRYIEEWKNLAIEEISLFNKNSSSKTRLIIIKQKKNQEGYEYNLIERDKLFLSKNLDDFLIRENKILLYKPHPFEEKISLEKYNNIRSIDPNVDIMDLLVIADLLITDYSGVFFDYLLTLRPILFFPYDLEKYTETRDFFYDYHSLVPGPIVRTGDQLISKLERIQEWDQQFLESRIKARDRFNKYHDGKAIQRIIKLLDLKLEKPIKPKIYPKIRIKRPVGRFNRIFNSALEFISKKVGMNIKHILSYPLSKLFSKKVYDNLLVFGSTNGNAFAGNPRTVFEYLCEHSNYHCVWITGSEKVFRDLLRQNYNVILNKNSIKRNISN